MSQPAIIKSELLYNKDVIFVITILNKYHYFTSLCKLISIYLLQSIIEICTKKLQGLITHPIKESYEKLLQKFNKLRVHGQTALGPGLLSAVALLKNIKGSKMIILCTDGMANIGLGNLETNSDNDK